MLLKQLEIFAEVARAANMSRAAERLGVSQPFLSKSISELEEELRVPLFDRQGRSIALNEYGRAFYCHVYRALAELEGGQEHLREMQDAADATVVLVCNGSLFIPHFLQQLHQQHPQIRTHQISAKRRTIFSMLESGDADYALFFAPYEPDDSSPFVGTEIIHEEIIFSCPDNHRFTRMRGVPPEELREEPLLTAVEGYGIREIADELFAELGFPPNIAIETSDTASIPNYLKAGLGYTMLASSLINRDPYLRRNRFRLTGRRILSTTYLIRARDRHRSAHKLAFEEFTRAYFAEVDKSIVRNAEWD